MSVFKRFRDITVASFHDMLDKMEDPVVMLNQYMRDMDSEISKAETAIARQEAMERKWQSLIDEMEARINKRDRQAQLAVDMGDDRVARQALSDKEYCQVKVEEYRDQLETATEQKRHLSEQLRQLKDKYDEMRNKKFTLIARANVASAKRQMNVAMAVIDTHSAAQGFQRIEERVMMMEADAHASDRMRTTYARDFAQKYETNDNVEQELAELKSMRQRHTNNPDESSTLS